MPGLFDGFRIGVTGIEAHRAKMEVVGNNIANASNSNYSRQEAVISTNGSIQDASGNIFGQGVRIDKVIRIRDEMLDDQIRRSKSSNSKFSIQTEWSERIQSIYNEPSQSSINQALSNFWEAWNKLSTQPENLATRSNLLNQSKYLTELIRSKGQDLKKLHSDVDNRLLLNIDEINSISEEISQLNKDIFRIEAGQASKANDLRDQRDAALDKLSEHINITYNTGNNGMTNVFINQHPIVLEDENEKLIATTDSMDSSKRQIRWEYGAILNHAGNGELAGILEVRDTLIPKHQKDFDQLASLLIKQVNDIYSQGSGLKPVTHMESALGYSSLGVSSPTESLSLIPTGEKRAFHLSFYDNNNNILHTEGIIIDSTESLSAIQSKLDTQLSSFKINGETANVAVTLISSTERDEDKRLSFNLSPSPTFSGFTLTNSNQGYDSSGFLSTFGFNQTNKSTASPPVLASSNLDDIATKLNIIPTDIQTTALNMEGTFTLNVFEKVTQTTPNSGFNIRQQSVSISSTDTLTDIKTKINAIDGFTASINTTDNVLEITSSIKTDDLGNINYDAHGNLSTTGSGVIISFANTYEAPTIATDEPPVGYAANSQNIGLMSLMQMNTFFSGSNALDMQVDDRILKAEDLHAGYSINPGDNSMVLDLLQIQHKKVAGSEQFTMDGFYQNMVSDSGSEVNYSKNLAENSDLMIKSFLAERDSISGVNLDEELANMILYQKSFEASARMISTFDKMAETILRL